MHSAELSAAILRVGNPLEIVRVVMQTRFRRIISHVNSTPAVGRS